jgi:hypothetical protein
MHVRFLSERCLLSCVHRQLSGVDMGAPPAGLLLISKHQDEASEDQAHENVRMLALCVTRFVLAGLNLQP